MSAVSELHGAVKRDDLAGIKALLEADRTLKWKKFSNASMEDWQESADAIASYGGVE